MAFAVWIAEDGIWNGQTVVVDAGAPSGSCFRVFTYDGMQRKGKVCADKDGKLTVGGVGPGPVYVMRV